MRFPARTSIAGLGLLLTLALAGCTDSNGAAPADDHAAGDAQGGEAVVLTDESAAADDSSAPDEASQPESLRAPVIPEDLPDDIPFAKMGLPRRKSLLDGIREYEGIEDPERESVYVGRREVGPISDYELEGSFETPEILAQTILDAILFDDPKMLHSLRITKPEFEYLFWDEFPQSRPATNILAGDAWGFHDATCHDGVSDVLNDHAGRELHLVEVKYTEGLAPYSNFNLVKGVVIWAVDNEGNDVFLDQARTFAERNGRWKVYIYKD